MSIFGLAPTIGEFRIVEDESLVVSTEDWSRVRSPSRAARRRRQGHRQNIRVVLVPRPDAFVCEQSRIIVVHPVVAVSLRQHLAKRLNLDVERTILGDPL